MPLDESKQYLIAGKLLARLLRLADEWDHLTVVATESRHPKLTRAPLGSVLEVPVPKESELSASGYIYHLPLCAYNQIPGDLASGVRVTAGWVVLDALTATVPGLYTPSAIAIPEQTFGPYPDTEYSLIAYADIINSGAYLVAAGVFVGGGAGNDYPVPEGCFRKYYAIAEVTATGYIIRRHPGGDIRVSSTAPGETTPAPTEPLP